MPDLARFQSDFAASIAAAGPESPLAIYRNTAALGAIDALAANFPTVRTIVGDEAFGQLARDFVDGMPPRSPVLATYGIGFPDFLEECGLAAELPYLSDVARIDRLRIEALFAGDAPALDLASLQAEAPDWRTLKVMLHPATRFGWFTSPAMTIWLAHEAPDEADEIVAEWTAGGALLTRPGDALQACAIDRAAHRLLFGLRLGETVGNAAIATLKLYPDTNVGLLFAWLASAGAFQALSS